jgi:molybdopterin biosynthesis enzyme
MIRKVKIEEAVGMVLGHDVVRITEGDAKAVPFQRGYVIREEDIPQFLDIGKEHIYVVETEEEEVHENEAALRIAQAVAGEGFDFETPSNGAVRIKPRYPGLLLVNVPLLNEVNAIGGFAIGTRYSFTVGKPEKPAAVAKTMPLYIPEAKLAELETMCRSRGRILELKPFILKKVGVVITGNEVFKGRIKDRFAETIVRKVEPFGASLSRTAKVPDDAAAIAGAIREIREAECEVIFACSGMSVDPDDVTMDGIRESGAEVVIEGVPMMPGAILGLAMLRGVPVIGTPAGALRVAPTALDGLLPMIFAGVRPTAADIISLGHGGLCLDKYAF